MSSKSTLSVRIRGISHSTEIDVLKAVANEHCFTSKKTTCTPVTTTNQPVVSLAADIEGGKVGTISFPSKDIKDQALRRHAPKWVWDDDFSEITLLRTPETADLDICAVHGLNGNAFDTFAHGPKMWLRDMLPEAQEFQNARIMTFGYNSQLSDRGNLVEILEWADALLHAVGMQRRSPEAEKRPIIFVCHSLGGIVAREAVLRLHESPTKYECISFGSCGLLFLSTPHSGSPKADLYKYLSGVAHPVLGSHVHAMVNLLQTCSKESESSRKKFEALNPQPPFKCLCEGRKTPIGPWQLEIVTKQSASLGSETAEQLAAYDHRQIARFQDKFEDGYLKVVRNLMKIKVDLGATGILTMPNPERTPGQPTPTAPSYPANETFYQGHDLPLSNHLVGRDSEFEDLEKLLERCQSKGGAIIVSGIGGIGKTEMLLALAYRCRHEKKKNVFVIRPHECATLDDSFVEMANQIGFDCLAPRWSVPERQEIWSTYGPAKRVAAFMGWLSLPENSQSIFIVDDLDSLGSSSEAIRAALPIEATNIIVSTRVPGLRLPRKQNFSLRLSPMKLDKTVKLMEAFIERSGYNEERSTRILNQQELSLIADGIHGHPLCALRAVHYIVNNHLNEDGVRPGKAFINELNSRDHEVRRHFLDHKPDFEMSIMEKFEQSRALLNDPDGQAWTLMTLIGFLQADPASGLRKFFGPRDWLEEIKDELPNYKTLSSSSISMSLSKLENASFGFRLKTDEPLQFHPVWLECLRHLIGAEGRIRAARQVLLICYQASLKLPKNDQDLRRCYLAHVNRCLEVCHNFHIELIHLHVGRAAMQWLSQKKEAAMRQLSQEKEEAALVIHSGLRVNRTW